jgi:hypothetical protein
MRIKYVELNAEVLRLYKPEDCDELAFIVNMLCQTYIPEARVFVDQLRLVD